MNNPRRIPLWLIMSLMLVLFSSVIFLHISAFRLITGAIKKYDPLLDASMEIRIEIAESRILMDHFLHGDSTISANTIREHIVKAQWYTNALLTGGRDQHNTFMAIKNDSLKSSVYSVKKALEKFRLTTEKQLSRDSGSTSTRLFNEAYLTAYKKVDTHTYRLESDVKNIITHHMDILKRMQLFIIIAAILITIAAVLIFRYYDRRRNNDLETIEKINTQLNIANKKLKANLNDVIEALTHPFYVIDANTYEIKLANSAAALGSSFSNTCYFLTHGKETPCNSAQCPCPLEEVKRTKAPVIVEHIHTASDGVNRHMEIHAYPIFDKQNNVVQMIEYALDVTERDQMLTDLRDLSNVYNLILENVPVQVCILDKNGILQNCWGIAYTLYHMDAENLIGSCVYKEFPVLEEKIKIALEGKTVQFENSGETDGKRWWFQTYLVLDKYNKENIIKISFDITENMLAKEEARKRKKQLIHADKMTTLGALVAGVAHEINNPNMFIAMGANNISMFHNEILTILEDYSRKHSDWKVAGRSYTETRDGIKKVVDGLLDGSKRISRIITSLKDFARPDTGNMKQSVAINDVIEDALEILHNMIKNSTNSFSFVPGMNIPKIMGNRQQIEQVIINLLTNACQALTDTSQTIRVETNYDTDTNTVSITIADEGCGIAEEALEIISQPFYTTKQLSGGLGIGLSLTYDIINSHKGTISYRSHVGEGTAATVSFPIATLEKSSHQVKVHFND